MIHDAYVAVTCDWDGCREEVRVMDSDSNNTIEARVRDEHDWLTEDDHHFCSEACRMDWYRDIGG